MPEFGDQVPGLLESLQAVTDIATAPAGRPDPVEFAPQTGVAVDSLVTSETVAIGGIDDGDLAPMQVAGDGDPQMQVNGGDWYPFAVVKNGDLVAVRATSSPDVSTESNVTLYMPGQAAVFTFTTSSSLTDTDAEAFWTAAGISDPDQQNAINDLVVDLKAASLWSKMRAIYPFVGGTSATHKWNLKDPQDTDAAYRLTFVHSPTHDANGMMPDPSGKYADTHFIPADHLTSNSVHMAYYSVSDTPAGDKTEMGNYNWDGSGYRSHLLIRYTGDLFYYGMQDSAGSNIGSSTDSRGLFVGTRTASNLTTGYRNGVSVGTNATTSTTQATNSTWIGGINSYVGFSDRQCAFASIGSGLTSGEVADLYTIVQAYQTALGRQV